MDPTSARATATSMMTDSEGARGAGWLRLGARAMNDTLDTEEVARHEFTAMDPTRARATTTSIVTDSEGARGDGWLRWGARAMNDALNTEEVARHEFAAMDPTSARATMYAQATAPLMVSSREGARGAG
jgi:hypothetical protein